MPTSTFIAPHDIHSQGAKALAKALKAKRILPNKSKYVYRNNHTIINWGRSSIPWATNTMRIVNKPAAVFKAICKIDTFNTLKSNKVSIPDFSTSIDEARKWINEGNTVFCRTLTRASAGRGIVVATKVDEIVAAPLYVKYKKKKSEFRIAVVGGKIIDFTQKKRRTDWDDAVNGQINNLIRSHDKGWVFCRENVNPPKTVLDLAIQAVKALGLDFGAVDIIFNERENKAYVLEVNTAMGLEGTSIQRYSQAFQQLINNQQITSIV